MVYNTKNGASLHKLPEKTQISGKDSGYYCWKLRQKEVKQ